MTRKEAVQAYERGHELFRLAREGEGIGELERGLVRVKADLELSRTIFGRLRFVPESMWKDSLDKARAISTEVCFGYLEGGQTYLTASLRTYEEP